MKLSLHLLHLIISEIDKGKYLKIFAKQVQEQYLCTKFFHFHSKPLLSPLLLKEQPQPPIPLSNSTQTFPPLGQPVLASKFAPFTAACGSRLSIGETFVGPEPAILHQGLTQTYVISVYSVYAEYRWQVSW